MQVSFYHMNCNLRILILYILITFTFCFFSYVIYNFRGIWLSGPNWEHNNQMGRYFMDSRRLCGEYNLKFLMFLLFLL